MAGLKEKVLADGNGSLAAGALFSVSSLACPCPVCIGSALVFLASGLREKFLAGNGRHQRNRAQVAGRKG